MGEVFPERNLDPIFERFGFYFYEAIKTMGWGYLLHNVEDHCYHPGLVRDFYWGFTTKDYDLNLGRLQLVWRGMERIISLEDIAAITGLPLKPYGTTPLPLIEYLPLMGPQCDIPPDSGIRASTTYRNVYTACRWACTNVTGTSKTSAFYTPTLAVVHALMTRDFHFCIVRQLFFTICSTRSRMESASNTLLPLPCLVTALCKSLMTDEEWQPISQHTIPVGLAITSKAYNTCEREFWSPSFASEDVPREETEEPIEEEVEREAIEDPFWQQDSPTNSNENRSRTWGALKRIFKKLGEIGDALSCTPKTKGESSRSVRGRKRK